MVIFLNFQCLYIFDFKFYFTPFIGFFSFFPYGTCSLLVIKIYLDLEGGPPIFKQNITVFVLLESLFFIFIWKILFFLQGYHLILLYFSIYSKKFFYSIFAHHYLQNLYWFIFLRVLRCFSFPSISYKIYIFIL